MTAVRWARRTFHSHRDALEELFDLSIVCDEHTNRYSIANSEDLNSHNITNWLLDSFAVGQVAARGPHAA